MRLFVNCISCLSVIALCSSVASAQQAAPAPAAEPAPAPAPPAPPLIRPYAIIKPEAIFASAAVESFGQPNASAITAAGNPVLAALPDESHLTFQAAQSRLGFWFDEKAAARGHIEFDFIDFTKSSPTTASVPRLRIAAVEWQLSDSLLLAAGQDWDLYQPVNPHTFNITAVAFQGGNTGFMRQQAKLIYHNESLELGAALGLAGVNNTAKTAVPEFGRVPSLALRASLLFGAGGRIGISALGTRWRFAPTTATERFAFAGAAGLFGDFTPVEHLNVRFEAYGGRNLANMGSLSLGTGNATNDLDEVGGFLSARYSLSDAHALYVLGSTAQVLNDEDVVPAYAYPAGTPAGMLPAPATATIAGTGPGMAWNYTGRLGYEYRYSKSIAMLVEGFVVHSKHVLDPIDTARFDAVRTALGGELGLLFTL
jgi:hypothetical protein